MKYSKDVLVSVVEQSDIYILFQIPFPYGLLQDIEYNSLCYGADPCGYLFYTQLLILNS